MTFEFSNGSFDIIIKIVVAALLGSFIGLERDIHGRAAGLRTHLLVCMGSAVFMILSKQIGAGASGGDSGRIAAQVVTGIGFLGAGTIIKEGFTVRGLTTASCLWVASGIGMAAGAGSYLLASSVTAITLFSLVGLNYFEKSYRRDSYRSLVIAVENSVDPSDIIEIIKITEIRIVYFDLEKNYESGVTTCRFFVKIFHKGITDKISHRLIDSLEEKGLALRSIKWEH